MNKKRSILIFTIILIILALAYGVYAYYEYYGKYSAIVHTNGTIRFDAFGYLEEDFRDIEDDGYGVSPENPFIIDNEIRMNNLIVLNNEGFLESAKTVYGTDKFYFALNFADEETPQILDLTGITQSSVGNNDYPFVDNLTGLLYSHIINDDEFVYLSAGGEVSISHKEGIVIVNGTATEFPGQTIEDGDYVKVPHFYKDLMLDDCIVDSEGNAYISLAKLAPVPQIIANATVKVPDDQIDIGFFSHIGRKYGNQTDQDGNVLMTKENIVDRSYVHDLILYNITIEATEESPGLVKAALQAIWDSILEAIPGHIFADKDEQTDERHIGIFAGHIDGSVKNITIGGETIIKIDAKDVNAYSRFTTVGYIDDLALINNRLFAELTQEGSAMGYLSGTLFADSIYALDVNPDGTTKLLKNIDGQESVWSGVYPGENYFSQGIFRFALSNEDDTISSIWNGKGIVKLLNEEGFEVTKSVLFASNEYRYSETQQEGGGLILEGASSNETRYGGITPLSASGSLIDKGKYVIVALHQGNYYALKIVADINQDGSIYHRFDTSSKIEVTDYINGQGQAGIYSSAIWVTHEDTVTPSFENARFSPEYLNFDPGISQVDLNLVQNQALATNFRYNVRESEFTYTVSVQEGDGFVTTKYYLNFNPLTYEFYFSQSNDSEIEMYQISNGFSFELVDSIDDLTVNDDYIIVARHNQQNYLLGAGTTLREDGVYVVDGSFSFDMPMQSFDGIWSLAEYQTYKGFVWSAASVSGASVSFREKLSASLLLRNNAGVLALDGTGSIWTYTQNQGLDGGTLTSGQRYLAFAGPAQSSTGYYLSNSPYTLYIYRLVPDDEEPDYNTYQGASLVTSDSSIVQEGQYMIGVETNTGYVAITMTGNNNLGTANISDYVNGIADEIELNKLTAGEANEGYKWLVETNSAKPTFKNAKYTARYLSRNGANTSPEASAASEQWMYDAISGRFYYENNLITYYLAYNRNGNNFVVTSDEANPAYDYKIRLYRVTYEYEYANMKPAQNVDYLVDSTRVINWISLNNQPFNDTGTGKYYFFLTEPLSEIETTAPYILGSYGTVDQSPVESVNLAPSSTYNAGTQVFKTTTDLAAYRWLLYTKHRNTGTSQNPNYQPFPTGYQFVNDLTKKYLGASNNPNSRNLVIVERSNINRNNTSTTNSLEYNGDGDSPTGFGLFGGNGGRDGGPFYRTNNQGQYIGNSLFIMGRKYDFEYFMWKTPTPGVFDLSLHRTNAEKPTGYSYSYVYEATSYKINVLISEIAEAGDNLEPDSHYMITALVEEDNFDTYYALSADFDELNNKVIKGANVTSQAIAINNSNILDEFGNIIEISSTDMLIMVPKESDWYQASSEKELNFYSDLLSTNSVKDYLTESQGEADIESINVQSSTEPKDWYYDAISKYMFFIDNNVKYYLKYSKDTDLFTLTTNQQDASHIYIYRFKPTYVMSPVTNAQNDSLKSGDFIIAGRDVGGYTAFGIHDDMLSLTERNITEYIKEVLTETEYKEIINYIWKQQYYDFSGATYDGNAQTQYLQPFSYLTGGGFTVIYNVSQRGMDLGADPMIWNMSNPNGLWALRNDRVNGSIGRNARGISFSKEVGYLRVSDTGVGPDRYLAAGANYFYTGSGSNFYLVDSNGDIVTQPVVSNTYMVVVRDASGNLAAVKKEAGNTVSLQAYSTLKNNQDAQWTLGQNNLRYTLSRQGTYLVTNAASEIVGQSSIDGGWQLGNGGELSYTTNPYVPYSTGNGNATGFSNNSSYAARVYTYQRSNNITTLTPTTLATMAGSNRVLVLINYDTNTYKVVRNSNRSTLALQTLTGVSVSNNGVITTSNSLSNYPFYTTNLSGNAVRFGSSQYSRYITENGSSLTSTSTSTKYWNADTDGYIYYSSGNTYTPKADYAYNTTNQVGSAMDVLFYEHDNGNYTLAQSLEDGKDYILLVKDDHIYYIIGMQNGVIRRTFIGEVLGAGWEDSIDPNLHHMRASMGTNAYRLRFITDTGYLHQSGGNLTRSVNPSSEWGYRFDGQGGSMSRLYTVGNYNISSQQLYVTGNNFIGVSSSNAEVTVYRVTENNGQYTLTLQRAALANNNDYIIVIYQDGDYYVVKDANPHVIAYKMGWGVYPEDITPDMIFSFNNNRLSRNGNYLRADNDGLYMSPSADGSWAHTYTQVNTNRFTAINNSTTNLNLFRLDKSSQLDDVTDITSMLAGKAKVAASISLLESGEYLVVAQVDSDNDGAIDKYYALSMLDIYNAHPMDVTELMKLSLSGQSDYITLFDLSVWINKGDDLNLVLDNKGFESAYYLTGLRGNYSEREPKIEYIPDENPPDLTNYTWRIYSFDISGQIVNLIGYTDSTGGIDVNYYMYFDYSSLTFKLTDNYMTAANVQSYVTIYQLAAKSVNQPVFRSFVIDVDYESERILSYPINKVELQSDFIQYQQIQGEHGTLTVGEYLIMAIKGNNYYALAPFSNQYSYVDVNPYYSGNFVIDDNNNYSLSINSEYLWKQVNDPSTGLNFENRRFDGTYLLNSDSVFVYDFNQNQLTNGQYYLHFDVLEGFSLKTYPSDIPITIYNVGETGINLEAGQGELAYTYYTQPLTTVDGSIDFSKFNFTKMLMPELKKYGMGYEGVLGSQPGWTLYEANEILEEAYTSIFLSEGVKNSDQFDQMYDEFIGVSHNTFYTDSEGVTTPRDIEYYVPTGMSSFVIEEASPEAPVFVNVIVSTEFDTSTNNEEFKRYLALWKMGNIDLEQGLASALLENTDMPGDKQGDFVHTFLDKRMKPYAAIPLPNRYGTEASGASYAKVDGLPYILSHAPYQEDYYVAHTYVVEEPGVYYLGSTYGSYAITYISIDNNPLAEEGEVQGMGYDTVFTIDFAFGEIDDMSIAYVGSDEWYQSNIYPQFIKGSPDNPTDYLMIKVNRTLIEDDEASSVNFYAFTDSDTAPNVQYANDNTVTQRVTRKVDFRVYTDILEVVPEEELGPDSLWTANVTNGIISFSKSYTNDFGTHKVYLAIAIDTFFGDLELDQPVAQFGDQYYWTIDEEGYIISHDDRYLVYYGDMLRLSNTEDNGVRVMTEDDGNLVLVLNPVSNGKYILAFESDGQDYFVDLQSD